MDVFFSSDGLLPFPTSRGNCVASGGRFAHVEIRQGQGASHAVSDIEAVIYEEDRVHVRRGALTAAESTKVDLATS
jgi:hypothetical protein